MVKVECIKGTARSSPPQVLQRLRARIKKSELAKTDEAWLVVDKDQWNDEHLKPLFDWSLLDERHGFAVSNPKFEYWLLLHFEDTTIEGPRQCSDKLQRHLPRYDKAIDGSKFSDEQILKAIARAKQRDNPPCEDWPRSFGTTVYKLVEKILDARQAT